MPLSVPMPPDASSEPIPYRALLRMSPNMSADLSEASDQTTTGTAGTSEAPLSRDVSADVSKAARPRSKRQVRLDAEARQMWNREQKPRTLDALRTLRAESESGLLQSPDLTRAALFQLPRADEVPPMPIWPHGHGRDKKKRNQPGTWDYSDEARAWRAQRDAHLEAVRRRREHHRAARLAPYNTWRNLGAAGERGGKRPGEHAYPPAWSNYLERFDREGTDGWGSPLGIAFRRMEREYAETKLLRALWLATSPDEILTEAEIAARLHVSQQHISRLVDAACKRLWAHMSAVIRGWGDPETRREQDEALRAEEDAMAYEEQREAK